MAHSQGVHEAWRVTSVEVSAQTCRMAGAQEDSMGIAPEKEGYEGCTEKIRALGECACRQSTTVNHGAGH